MARGRLRVGILGLLQESNTFLPQRTTWQDFAADTLARGEEVRACFADAQHEIGGFFAGLTRASIEPVPIFAARALPYGTIEADTFERLVASMLAALQDAGEMEGLLVAPHGATVSESYPDADGHWLSQIRTAVGPDTPIVGTLDPHANLTPQMVAACDALLAYRTNPHLDQHDCGLSAAQLLVCMLKEGIRPTMAAAYPPLAMSIDCQCTEQSPCRELFRDADTMLQDASVLTNSILLGFPYADVPEIGSATIVVTDGNQPLADRLADQLAHALWDAREQLTCMSPGIDAALEQALRAEPPVCLLDMGDNVGGGSPGDGTWLAQALVERAIDRSLVVLYDPLAADAAREAGVGSRLPLPVGGRSDVTSGPPLSTAFTVVSLHDGRFMESQPMHGGYTCFDQGPTAVLSTERGLTVVVTSRRMVPFSLAQLTSCALDPTTYRLLVAKGVNAPLAAYRRVCRTFIRVNTPGRTCADITTLDFKHRRRPMFPFEPETVY